ncbi:hypothetical protein N9966_00030 [bacterium]|nr:hypothetical protein [bacterium]|tara:strand:- start:22 stop:426 length:405 start_codon:yes stop_codon:yes gene_type:complete
MQKKIILLATFVEPKYLEKFLSKLLKKFSIKKESVFIFETEDGDYLLTYRIFLNVGQRIDIRKEFRKTIQIHKKGLTFFTINALNKLIEKEFNLIPGNIDYKSHEIKWEKYKNKLILLKNGELDILDLKKKINE